MSANPVLLLLVCALTCSSEKQSENRMKTPAPPLKKVTGSPEFNEAWNNTFHLRTTETGEILSVGAVFSNRENVFVYDMAENRIVTFDTNLHITDSVSLPSIGRNRYVGDDFVVMNEQFIFLNTVDNRLEFFEQTSGKHLRASPLPRTLLSSVKQRSRRIIDRLFIDEGVLYIGNRYHLIPFDVSLGKKAAEAKVASAPEKRRWLLFNTDQPFTEDKRHSIAGPGGRQYRKTPTHFPVSGKRFFKIGTKLYGIDAGRDGIRIAKVK
jgi:hypothetical protein